MRERDVEAYLKTKIETLGGACWKFSSPAQRGVPDRICILYGQTFFVEVKAPGKVPTALQQFVLHRINDLGGYAVTVDSREAVDRLLESLA